MKCNDYLEDLSAYIDNELDEIDKQELEKHLKTCEACQETLHTLEEVKMCMSDISNIELPQHFHSTMMERLSKEVTKGKKKEPKKLNSRIITYVSAMAAALFIVWIGSNNETEILLQTPQAINVENSQDEPMVAEVKGAPLMTARSQMNDKESAETPMSIAPMSVEPTQTIIEELEWVIQVDDQEKAYMTINEIANENQFVIEGIPYTECIISLNEIGDIEHLRNSIEERLGVQIESENAPEFLNIKIILTN